MLIQTDYHIHASFYRDRHPDQPAGPTAAEQAAAARRAGSVRIGIVEHCNASPRHPFHCLEELSAEFHSANFDRKNIFLGVEADLDDNGNDHCGPEGRRHLRLDYVIGSVHLSPKIIPDVRNYIECEYRRIAAALENNDNVDVIGHPFGEGMRYESAGIIPKWGFCLIPPEYLHNLLFLAKKSGKALEINRCDENDPVYMEFLGKMRDAEVLFTVGSDAHFPEGAVDAALRTRIAEKLGFSEKFHWSPSCGDTK